MLRLTGGLERVLMKYPDLDLTKVKLIGWGAGSAFRDFFPRVPLPLAYTVCPLTENQGKTLHGLEVKAPSALLKEDRENSLIVIYARFSSEIMSQIRLNLGDFRTIPAMRIGPSRQPADISELQDLARGIQTMTVQRPTPRNPQIGIFTQGPIFPCTPLVLAQQRLHYPGAYTCFVTWDHQAGSLIDSCAPRVDHVITIPQPPLVVDPRNPNLRSCRAGAEHIATRGVRYAVRTRSDHALTGSLYRAIDHVFEDGRRNAGKFGMLAGVSWRYVPFHFCDRFLISHPDDMLALWSTPEDTRPASEINALGHEPYQNIRNAAFECYLWAHYARTLGYPTDGLPESYRFAAEKFVPMDDHVGVFSIKHTPLFNLGIDTNIVGSPRWYEDVRANLDSALDDARGIQEQGFTVDDHFAVRIG
ncbi:MAG: hypothetical protein ACOVQ6_21100 [Brevundimonas sp.]